ncbi:hypothetical protein Fmac_014187 [Flemingia macrophylla]|uniref:Transmembrane protein n=1 Tax=Flemingia macrophylla TaxID=520843 RepID=A0ABD1MB14_9FABA
MNFIARFCLLFLLLTYAVMSFAINNPKGDLNSNIDDYPDPGPNPSHTPPPLTPDNRKMKISVDDYPGVGPNPKHRPGHPPIQFHV